MNIDEIKKAVDQFVAASAASKAYDKAGSELRIDKAIAERSGDADAIEKAEAASKEHSANWHGHYMARRDCAKAVATVLGLDPVALRDALPTN